MIEKRILAAALAVLMLVSEPIYSQCRSCGVSSSSCGSARGGLFGGRLFSGRLRSRLAERRERRANRRAARHEASCGHAAAPSCGVEASGCPDGQCPVNETSFDSPPDPAKEITPSRQFEGSEAPPNQRLKTESTFGAHAAWKPPFPLRPSAIDTPSPFDEPAQKAQTAAVKSFHPFPLGLMAAPY